MAKGVIKLRLSRGGIYLGIWVGPLCNHKYPYKRDTHRASLAVQWLKNPPANVRYTVWKYPDLGSILVDPWSGKISHAAEQLSPCASNTEPAL